jgi:hypothetical protein
MSKKQQTTRQAQRRERREERHREEERLRAVKKRLTLWISVGVGIVVVVIAAIVLYNISGNALANSSASNAKNQAIASDNPAYPVVDNIACQTHEQLAYHIHAHLSIYVDDKPVSLPANVGIASDQSCIYWLHTHDSSGVIHIESPNANTYSLGTFFTEWDDHFSQLGYPSQLNTTDGWQVYVDGKPYNGDFHKIQLVAHKLITLAYNSPKITSDTTYSWGDL